jgi:DNA-binding response OmpR family regulator
MADAPEGKDAGSILVIGDDLSARQTLSQLLEREGYQVRCAPSGQTALLFACEEPPELILLDIRLPDVEGFEVCRRLKEDSGTRAVPVIFLSALGEAEDKVKGFAAGGADYIAKPFHAEEVLARVRTHLALYRLQRDLERRVEERTVALRRSEESLNERLRFEAMLSDLSTKFLNVPADRVDPEIEDAQRRICEDLDLDVSSLWQGSVVLPNLLTLTHFYRRVDGPRPPEQQMRGSEYFPWTYQQLIAGKVVAVSSTEDVPAEAARDRETWRYFGIKYPVHPARRQCRPPGGGVPVLPGHPARGVPPVHPHHRGLRLRLSHGPTRAGASGRAAIGRSSSRRATWSRRARSRRSSTAGS